MTKKEAYAKLDAILEITNTYRSHELACRITYDDVSDIMSLDEYLAGGDINHPDTEDPFAKLARSGPELPPPIQEHVEANERAVRTAREVEFEFFSYHLEMTKADFDVLAQNPKEMSDLACDIRDFEHHECSEECPTECPGALPLRRGEYKAYLAWCADLAEVQAADMEEEEWEAFKRECTAADEEYAADPLDLSNRGILIRRPAPTTEELRAMIGSTEAKEKYEAELADWISRAIKEGLRLDQSRAEAEAIELAQKNWDASQKTAKAKCPASLRSGSIARRVLPEPQTELLPYPLALPDAPED